MKNRLPFERISNESSELLKQGSADEGNLLAILIQKSVKKPIQEILEQQIEDYPGRGYFERKPGPANKGYRNGYEPESIKTAEGKMVLDVPQLRNTEET